MYIVYMSQSLYYVEFFLYLPGLDYYHFRKIVSFI